MTDEPSPDTPEQPTAKHQMIGGAAVLLVLVVVCGGLWRCAATAPDVVSMSDLLTAAYHYTLAAGQDKTGIEFSISQAIRDTPKDERRAFVDDILEDLFAKGWHIDVTQGWDEYPKGLDADWYKDKSTVNSVKRLMRKKLIADATRPKGAR